MTEKTSKKSYYLPVKLMEAFARFCSPGREYSTRIAGLILAGMALDNNQLLDQLSKLAYTDNMAKAKKEAKKIIDDFLLNEKILEELEELAPNRAEFLHLVLQAKENISRR